MGRLVIQYAFVIMVVIYLVYQIADSSVLGGGVLPIEVDEQPDIFEGDAHDQPGEFGGITHEFFELGHLLGVLVGVQLQQILVKLRYLCPLFPFLI